jgi:hypothetical protein
MKKPEHITSDKAGLNWMCDRCLKRLSMKSYNNPKVLAFFEKHKDCLPNVGKI